MARVVGIIKAVGKRIIVKEIVEDTEETKPIIITVKQNKPLKAEVISIGSDVDENVIEGDIVILPSHTGTPVEIEAVKYLSIYEDQILAIEGK